MSRHISEPSELVAPFSPGDFKPLSKKATKTTTHVADTEKIPNANPVESNKAVGVYSCPQDGCVRTFQRVSALEKHLSLERCTRSPERHTVIDQAKMGYKSALEEGVGAPPTPKSSTLSQDYPIAAAKEGWALRAVKKAYRFSDKQNCYLLAKFRIGQTTGRELDAEVVAREMRRALGADYLRLFQSSEFLTASQIASYFSRLNAAARQQDMDELDIQASEEETNFTSARDVVATASQIQHPITYDQFDLCSMAKGDTLKTLKLPMLQRVCEGLGLDVPQPPVRRKAPYMELLKDITQNCAYQQ